MTDHSQKITILMGRGVEGCGVTRSVKEFRDYYGPNLTVYATDDREWVRGNSENYGFITFHASNWEECKDVARKINDGDHLIVYSLPSHNKHPIECQTNFLRLLEEVTIHKSMVHCDHSHKALSDNANLDEIIKRMDLVMSHSTTGVLKRHMDKVGLKTQFDTMGVGFNYDATRAKYWKPIEAQNKKRIRWLGRSAVWKGPNLLIDFHEKMLRSRGWITVLEGLEASMQSVLVLYHDGFEKKQPKDVIQRFRGPKAGRIFEYGEETPGNPAYLYPLYVNSECLERLSLDPFGSDLYFLAPEKYGNNIENCHAEPVAVGTVPIFHKHFGDHVIHRNTGRPCTDSDDSGTVWLDSSNYDATLELLDRLDSDDELRSMWRERAYEFWKAHSDTRFVVEDILEKINRPRVTATVLEDFFS